MTEFNTQVGEGTFHLQFDTDNKEHYNYVQKAVRDCIDSTLTDKEPCEFCKGMEFLYGGFSGTGHVTEAGEHLLQEELNKVVEALRYYLETNEENGVVYIPKFVVETIVNKRSAGESNV